MPELPDIELYVTRLSERIIGSQLDALSIFNPFVLRSTKVKPGDLAGETVSAVSRIGKRIVLEFASGRAAIFHLMIAGRLTWVSPLPPASRPTGKIQLAALRFSTGQLVLQEVSSKKRASIFISENPAETASLRRAGIDIRTATQSEFISALQAENRTLKRALTDPSKFDGIGNAYSDEILFAAKLSPTKLSQSLSEGEVSRLRNATRETLDQWAAKLRAEIPGFPKPAEVTAFRPDFAVHGRFGKPCPVCQAPVQRIVYAENEANYCAACQNGGRLLADRSLSRLLKDDWPKTLEEMIGP